MGLQDRAYYSQDPPRGLAPSWNNRSAISIIIIANVCVFVANLLFARPGSPGVVMGLLTLHTDDIYHPWMWWRALSYGFAHDPNGIGHIFWNMLGLWMLGRAVEEHYGRSEFFRIYLSSIVVCGLGYLLRHWVLGQTGSVLGASGAVCCIEMLFVLNYPRVILMIWGVIPAPAWVIGVMLIGGSIFLDPLQDRVAYDVHLVGILFAVAYFFLSWNFGELFTMASMRRSWRRWTGPRLKVHSPKSSSGTTEKEDQEMDRLLQKIHDRGPDSLTSSERKFMERCSRKLRERRQNS